jgi:hypothetical protein
MKGLIILFGESFRFGGQHTNSRGLAKSYLEQIKAAQSHISFAQDLKEKNYNIDFYISSYDTQYTSHLNKVYSNNLIGSDYYLKLIGQHNLIHNAIKKIINLETYDFVLFMRIDLFLKDKFIEIFDPKWDKILFPTICYKPYHKSGIHPRVNDMIIYFPKKYFNYIKDILYNPTGHDLWKHYIDTTDLTYDDMDTMINTYHDSDSQKDFNPLYYIVNRQKSEIVHTKDDIFDKFNFK